MSTFGTVINGMRKAGFDIMVNTNQKVLATKKIVVMTMGIIPELGGISGPILTPQDFPIGIVQALVNSRRKVYECNPKNPSERILLTISNVNANNFAPKKVENPSMIVERRNNIKKIGYERTLHLWVEVKFNLIKNNANMLIGGDIRLYISYLFKIDNPITQEFLTL